MNEWQEITIIYYLIMIKPSPADMQTIPHQVPAGFVAKTLFTRLVKLLRPELIFCRNRHLLLVLPNHPALSLKDYQEKIKACRLPRNYTHTLLFYCELERQYRLGNLFITTFCIPVNCIYNNSGKVNTPFWQRFRETREAAILDFNNGMNKARAFFQGACFYWATSDCAMTAFMLHQACELCLRAVNMAFSREQVKTHIIAELMYHARKYLPELAAFFNTNTEKEKQLLNLLEKAYSQVRYTHTYQIPSAEVLQLLQQVRILHQTTEQLMQQTMQRYPDYVLEDSADLFIYYGSCHIDHHITLNQAV